jgi:hypothetical protein
MGVSGTSVTIKKYGSCRPTIYVDGNRLQPGWDVESAVDPETIVGVEVFRGTSEIPLEFGQFEPCGVILIWTDIGGAG